MELSHSSLIWVLVPFTIALIFYSYRFFKLQDKDNKFLWIELIIYFLWAVVVFCIFLIFASKSFGPSPVVNGSFMLHPYCDEMKPEDIIGNSTNCKSRLPEIIYPFEEK